ncbi:SAM-dependent methyltransferase [Streptomyces albipurpureus]|uniref:SAM-dependent methyltransferase n=1 Tax=Streptomyces albipurpureus TaxID=2897419 RepID=A0ABT0UK98_9ACTN|nr:SAM-dependent methyltransferase [Streptomyces sp. CWNU-1]MCM2388786.1 SAM-dependent methyltransferase [Streptomyces sp. CWNU-1]
MMPDSFADATSARVHDWLLGGTENYGADREAGAALLEMLPHAPLLARAARAFLTRTVGALAKEGIAQFLDHGCGLPAEVTVHEVAQAARDGARVVYIDNDSMVLAHARTYLDDNEDTMVLDRDIRAPQAIREATQGFLDWQEPIAALFVNVLDCLPTDEGAGPGDVVRATVERLVPGSRVIICQVVSDDAAICERVTELMAGVKGGRWGRLCGTVEFRGYFEGLETESPGPGEVNGTSTGSGFSSPSAHSPVTGAMLWAGIGRVPGDCLQPPGHDTAATLTARAGRSP